MATTSKHNLYQANHPLISNYLTLLRSKECIHNQYRRCIRHLAVLLAYEALRIMHPPMTGIRIETPFGEVIDDQEMMMSEKMAIVAVLRGGMVPAAAILVILPRAPIVHIATSKSDNDVTKTTYERIPDDLDDKSCLIVQPRIETGDTTITILERIHEIRGSLDNTIVTNMVCAPEGITNVFSKYPNVPIVTASLEEGLNENLEVVPGIGRVGDRLYETDLDS